MFLLYTSELCYILDSKLIGYVDNSYSPLIAVVPFPGLRVSIVESLSRDLVKVSEWCDRFGMKLNASKSNTMIVSRSRTVHSMSPTLTIEGKVLKESDDLVILGVTFASKMILRSIVPRFPQQILKGIGILRKSWQVFHDRLLLGRCFRGFVLPDIIVLLLFV